MIRMDDLKIATICDVENFKTLRSEWDALLQKSFSNGLFLTWEWVYSWWKAYHTKKELNIICVRNNHNYLIGIAPLFIHKTKYYKANVSELTFIGDLSSDRQDFIVDKKYPEVYKLIVSSILAKTNWTIVRLEQIPEWSCLVTDAKKDRRYELEETSYLPFIKIHSDWEIFYKGLSSKFKRDLNHKNNVLKREGVWEYKTINHLDNIEDKLKFFFEIELKSRKNNTGRALFADKRAMYFQQLFSKYGSDRGWLSLSCINLNNNPVSYLIGYIYDNKYIAYNTAYLPEYYRASPGKLILNETIKYCFKQKLSEFDFLRGATDVKSRWTKTNRTNYRIIIFNKGLKGSILRLAVFVIRPFLKKQMNNKFINRLISFKTKVQMFNKRK